MDPTYNERSFLFSVNNKDEEEKSGDRKNNNDKNNNNNNEVPTLYSQRWIALILFCLINMFQSNCWMTYSSVADTAMDIYDILLYYLYSLC